MGRRSGGLARVVMLKLSMWGQAGQPQQPAPRLADCAQCPPGCFRPFLRPSSALTGIVGETSRRRKAERSIRRAAGALQRVLLGQNHPAAFLNRLAGRRAPRCLRLGCRCLSGPTGRPAPRRRHNILVLTVWSVLSAAGCALAAQLGAPPPARPNSAPVHAACGPAPVQSIRCQRRPDPLAAARHSAAATAGMERS